MDLGVLLFPQAGRSAGLAQLVESLGFASLVFADTQNITPEVWGQLMLAASATERIELGTGVTNATTRDAAVTASAAASLQVESGGRAICGIGRGDSSLAKIGRKPAKLAEFESYLETLQSYLRGDSPQRGETHNKLEWLADANVPKVPVEVAATGPKVIELAARHADRIVFAVGADVERLEGCLALAKNAAEKAGRNPDDLKYGAWVNAVINPDIARAREGIRGGLSVFAHFSGFAGAKTEGLDESTRRAAEHLRANYDMANHGKASGAHAQALDDQFIDRFGIVGPAETAIPRFQALVDLGLDFCRVIPGSRDMPADMSFESLRGLGEDVLPNLS